MGIDWLPRPQLPAVRGIAPHASLTNGLKKPPGEIGHDFFTDFQYLVNTFGKHLADCYYSDLHTKQCFCMSELVICKY